MPERFDDEFDALEDPDGSDIAEADDRIRRSLSEFVPADDHAAAVLVGLRRPLGRARRRHQVRTAVAGGVAAALLLTVSLSVLPGSDTTTAVVADAPEPSGSTVPTTSPATIPEPLGPDTAGPTTTTNATATTDRPTSAPASAAPPSSAPGSTAPAPATPSTSPASTTPPTSSPPATTPPSSTLPGDVRVDSECGSLIVSALNDTLRLQQTMPLAGFIATTETSGRSEMTVTLTGPSGTCEIHLTASRGQVRSEVGFEPADGADHGTDED